MVTYINRSISYMIGELDFDILLINEVNIDKNKYFPTFPNSFKGKCYIEIYGFEGENIPHFHITSVDGKFSCCIQLFDNRFFTHGKHLDTLHKKDWEKLDSWLRLKNHINNDLTNWEYAKSIWMDLYNTEKYKSKIQPDYTTIESYKEK